MDLDLKLLKSVVAQYDIGILVGRPEKLRGDQDINYKIVTDKGVYLLKYVINKKNLPQFECLGPLHEYLREKNIPFPKIYKTLNDKYVENDFILYEFIDGETKNDWTDEEIISLTENFAQMLIVLRDYEVPKFIKNKDDKYTKGYDMRYCHDVFRSIILDLQIPEKLKTDIIEVIDILYSKISQFEKLPKYLIHGDLNEMNAIFKNGKNVGIIDLGGSYDPIVYDLGEFIYWFTMPVWSKEFNDERYQLIMKTFEDVLPLSFDEKDLLPYMILRRGMMDMMLTLQYYLDNQSNCAFPEDRLKLLILRNKKIIELIK